MYKLYLWAIAEKLFSCVPFRRSFAEDLYYRLRGNSLGKSPSVSSYRLARKAKDLVPKGGSVMDVGTGWFHHDAFLVYLLGDYRIYLFDIEEKARLRYIHNYLRYLLSSRDLLYSELGISPETVRDKIAPLLNLDSKDSIYKKCNFIPCVTRKTEEPFLPEESIDFMMSNCVLNHIPYDVLVPELHTLRRMLKKDGYMYHLLGHVDHWFFHDHSANLFNYYRYSDAYYRMIFESKMEYQNRMVKQEWLNLFHNCNLDVKEYVAIITDKSRSEIARLPKIDSRFAVYTLQDLAITDSLVLLQRAL